MYAEKVDTFRNIVAQIVNLQDFVSKTKIALIVSWLKTLVELSVPERNHVAMPQK